MYNSKNKPPASNIGGIDSYIWSRCPRVSDHPSWSASTTYYYLGIFYLLQNGYQAVLTVAANQGYGLTAGYKSTTYPSPQNYQLKIYLYSGNANADVPTTGKYALSIALDAGTDATNKNKGCFHFGIYEVVGMWAKPNNVYLCPFIDGPSNYVSVWVQNTAHWGQPLITCETNGLW